LSTGGAVPIRTNRVFILVLVCLSVTSIFVTLSLLIAAVMIH